MEQDFYAGRLRDEHELTVVVPDERDRHIVHEVIYRELCVGITEESSRSEYRRIMRQLADRGAGCILFGCTEIELLIEPHDAPVPVFETTRLHAQKAVAVALGEPVVTSIGIASRNRPELEYVSDPPRPEKASAGE
jgi:amino-acid racemase